ncbi:hypothetical protein [Nocardiopsis sp. YSL2]|nr:hypothetical protein [Nocardiopsis sp. YSL2]
MAVLIIKGEAGTGGVPAGLPPVAHAALNKAPLGFTTSELLRRRDGLHLL